MQHEACMIAGVHPDDGVQEVTGAFYCLPLVFGMDQCVVSDSRESLEVLPAGELRCGASNDLEPHRHILDSLAAGKFKPQGLADGKLAAVESVSGWHCESESEVMIEF